jgi:hypothetical protein
MTILRGGSRRLLETPSAEGESSKRVQDQKNTNDSMRTQNIQQQDLARRRTYYAKVGVLPIVHSQRAHRAT